MLPQEATTKNNDMKKIKETVKAFLAIPYIKYIVVLVAGIVLIGFGGSNSVWSHFKHKILISELKEEIEIYEGEYQRDQAQIHQLQSNPKAMERIARERYFMKNDGEDIFVLSEDEQSLNTNDDNEATEQD